MGRPLTRRDPVSKYIWYRRKMWFGRDEWGAKVADCQEGRMYKAYRGWEDSASSDIGSRTQGANHYVQGEHTGGA